MAQQRRSPRAREREAAARPEYYKMIRSRTDTQDITHVVLRNGLTLLVRELHSHPIAAIVTYVKVGYFNESNDVAGISHVLEHMFFKGTKKRGMGKIAADTRKLGGALNASTAYDHTSYYTVVPAEHVVSALEIQADALQNSALDAEELRKELLVIIQEAKRKRDNPPFYALEKMYELAFEKHRMRRWRIGAEAALKAMTREQLVKFYNDFYKPANIILSVCGDVSVEQIVAEVARRYGAMSGGKLSESLSPVEPEQSQLKYVELRGDITQSYVFVGFHAPGVTHSDFYPLTVLAYMLGQGQGARLNQRLKEKQKLVTSIAAHMTDFKSTGMFTIDFRANAEQLDKAELSLFTELEVLKEDEITDEDLARALAMIERDYYQQVETAQEIAEKMARFEDLGGIKTQGTHLEKFRKVTLADVERVLTKYVKTANATVLEYQPKSAEPRGFTMESFSTTLAQVLPTSVQQRLTEKSPLPEMAGALLPANDNYAFEAKQTAGAIIRPSILRGPEIFIREEHTTPTLTIGFFFPGGRSLENEKNSGISELLLRAALKGTVEPPPSKLEHSASFLATQMEMWGGRITPVVDDDYYGYLLTVLSKNVEAGLKLLLEVIRQPKLDVNEVEKEKAAMVSRIRSAKDDNFSHTLDLFRKALFKEHPYAQPRRGREASVKSITVDDLKAWHKLHMARTKPLIAIIGDTQGTALATFFAKNLQRMEYVSAKLPKPQEIVVAAPVAEIEPREKQQTAIVVGFPISGVSAEDAYALDILQHLAAGLGGRFFTELRDRQSLAYTVTARVQDSALGGSLYGYMAASPENEVKALEGLKNEFRKLKTDALTPTEFSEAASSATGSHLIGIQNRPMLIQRLIKTTVLGRNYEDVQGYVSKLKSVSKEDVKTVAERFIDLEHCVVAILRSTDDAPR
ncbi:MAG: insulinase family protein [Acidobacteria bacterium]|nr:insulinase family protein [Acidobacteriota bacterium]MBI3658382.1 insulinase family protein [Acidobacteriota bacterium]